MLGSFFFLSSYIWSWEWQCVILCFLWQQDHKWGGEFFTNIFNKKHICRFHEQHQQYLSSKRQRESTGINNIHFLSRCHRRRGCCGRHCWSGRSGLNVFLRVFLLLLDSIGLVGLKVQHQEFRLFCAIARTDGANQFGGIGPDPPNHAPTSTAF